MHKCGTIAWWGGLAASCLLAACSQKAAPPAAPPAPKPPTAAERLAFYNQCWEYFNSANWAQFRSCYADDATAEQYGGGKPPALDSVAAIMADAQDFKKSFPDARGDALMTLINGTHVFSIHVLHGTNTGPLTGADGKEMPATGKAISLMYANAFELAPDALQAKHETGMLDSGTTAAQLGLSKMPARGLAQVPAAGSAVTVMAANDATEQSNLAAEQAMFDAWNKHDEQAFEAYLTADYVTHSYGDPKDMDRAGQAALDKEFWNGVSDAHLTDTLWAAGDYVVATGELTGTNDGPLPSMKLKKTGNKIAVPYMQVDRFVGGKVREEWLFFDSGEYAKQLMAKK
jgi:predicted ester cyclase